MQPEIFLSVPLYGHAAASGQVKAQEGAEDADFGRLFARLTGDEIRRETPKIEALPSGRPVKASDGEAEDTAIPEGAAATVEDAELLPDEAPALDEGEPHSDQAPAHADDKVLPGEAKQQSQSVAHPAALATDLPGDPGAIWRSSAGQVTGDASKPATAPDIKRIGEGLRPQGPETRHATERVVLNRLDSMTRETGDPRVSSFNANGSMGRHDAVPAPSSDEAALTMVSAELKVPQSEVESEIRTETPKLENRESQGPTRFSKAIALRQEVAGAPQINPAAADPATGTSIEDGEAANEKALLHIPDARAGILESYRGRDAPLADSPKDKNAVPVGHGAGITDLPRLDGVAVVDPGDDTNQTATLLAAMTATSSSLQSQDPARNGLPIATETTPRESVGNKMGFASQVSTTDPFAVAPLNGGQDPASHRNTVSGGQRIDDVAAAAQPVGRLAQPAYGTTVPSGLAQIPVDPVALSRGPEFSESSDGPVSTGLTVPDEASTPRADRFGPGVAVQRPQRQAYSPDLVPAEPKQGARLPDAPAHGLSEVAVNAPRLPEGQTVGMNEKVEMRPQFLSGPYLNTPARAFTSPQEDPLAPPLKLGQFRQDTTNPRLVEPSLLSDASRKETGPVNRAKTQADRLEPQGNRVVPSVGGNPGLETGQGAQTHTETRPVKSARLPTAGQPWPSLQGLGEITRQTGRTAPRIGRGVVEGEAQSKTIAKDQSVEIRNLPRENPDPKPIAQSQEGGDRGTGLVTVSDHRSSGPSVKPYAELPVRRPAITDHAQRPDQYGPTHSNGTQVKMRGVGINPRSRPIAMDTPETGRNRLTDPSETGRHEVPERRLTPQVSQTGDASRIVSEGRAESGFGLNDGRQSIRGSAVRLDEENAEHRHGAADKHRPGTVQPQVFSELPPPLPKRPEGMGDSRNADRAETARPTSFEMRLAPSVRSDEIARPPNAQGDMPQLQDSLAKSLTGAPADVAMPRSLPEITGLAPRDIPTSEAPAPPSLTQHAALARDVAQQLSQVVRSVPGEVTELTLRPEELGQVRMRLSGSDGQIVLQILSERPETHDLMRRHIDIVERAFRDLGYHDIAFDFSFSGQRKGGPQTQGEPSPTEDVQVAELLPAQPAVRRQVLVPGRLDIRL